MGVRKSDLFKRQTTLSEIGELGQQKLQDAKVLIVGCGGLGSAIAVYLAASGVGSLHLVDFDKVDVTNLHRQVFYRLKDVGNFKAKVLTSVIQQRAPFTKVTFSTRAFSKSNAANLVSDYPIVVDGTDSLPTKYLLNDVCVLQGKPLVYGSLYKFDGYVSTFNLQQNKGNYSSNLRDAFPKIDTDIPNCEEAGTLNPIVGIIALAQVNEVIKLITGIGKPLQNELLIYNALSNQQLKMKVTPRVSKKEIEFFFANHNYYDDACAIKNPDWEISPKELKFRLGESNLEIIAVLPNLKLPFQVHRTIPLQKIPSFLVDERKTYVLVCQKGNTSYKATQLLKEKYPKLNVLSLEGGVSNYPTL